MTSNSVVVLTGVTGFLGKVVLGELLRRREELALSSIIVLIRSKGDRDARQRFNESVAASQCFSLLPSNWTQHVQVVSADLPLYHCGISLSDYTRIKSSATHIIHCAGCTKFTSPVSEVLPTNVDATLNMLELAQGCPNLRRLVHTSTAYVTNPSPDSGNDALLGEDQVSLPWAPADVYEDLQKGRRSDAHVLAESGYPNTYTFTKALAEALLLERRGFTPLTIVRPSIISASWRQPFPGWIDSKAAFAAFVLGCGSGLLRVIAGNKNTMLDIVPVDGVASNCIDEAFYAPRSILPARIVHSVAGPDNQAHLGTTLGMITSHFSEKRERHKKQEPQTGQRRPKSTPDLSAVEMARFKSKSISMRNPKVSYLGPRNLRFALHATVEHDLPLLATSAALWVTQRPASLFASKASNRDAASLNRRPLDAPRKTARLLAAINEVFPPYTTQTWRFGTSAQMSGGGIGAIPSGWRLEEYLLVVFEGVIEHLIPDRGSKGPPSNHRQERISEPVGDGTFEEVTV